MKTRVATMLMVGLLFSLLAGCQDQTAKPVEEAPQVHKEPLPSFPEGQVPQTESQPQPAVTPASAAPVTESPPPVDTTTTVPPKKSSKTAAAKQQPKERHASAEKVKKAPRTYVVRKGDTLQKISQKFYGTTTKWRRIQKANKGVLGKDPDKLGVGTKLVIP